jgi:F-type H+-transporting ATPase subunit epsilon
MKNLFIKFKIITPEHLVLEDEVEQVTLPTGDGEVTVLPNHISYIASLGSGEIVLKKKGKESSLAVAGGFIEFNKNQMVILADMAERAEEIDLQLAEAGKKRAEEAMREKITDEAEYASVASAIQKESARIKVAKKHRSKRGIEIDSQ